jgi:uncharacterized protein (DUF885 family)
MLRRRSAIALVASIGLPLRGEAAEPGAGEARRLHDLFARQWEDSARRFPEFATFRGDHRFGDRLTDRSREGRAAHDAAARAFLAEARAIRRDALAPRDRVSLDLFIDRHEREVDEQSLPGPRTTTLGALGGVHTALAHLLRVTPTNTREHADQLLARLAAVPRRMDQEIDVLREGIALGWVAAKDVVARVLAQIDSQVQAPVESGPFYGPFGRLGSAIPEADRARLQAAGRQAIERDVIVPMRKLREFVANEYAPKAPASGAYSGYPDGERAYAMAVRRGTTTTQSVRDIHELGLRELARIRAEMDRTMAQSGHQGSFAEFIGFLYTDPRFRPADGQALLALYRDVGKRIDAELPRLFAELPRLPYGIRAMPDHLGPDHAEYYDGPALDGSRPGWFNAQVLGWRNKRTWDAETLVAHEAVPGHHLQIARANELGDLPPFRRVPFAYTAFVEGWALYAETLGFDIGLYRDPYSRFGHLQWQAFRAARLAVDTGFHALGWSRQRSIDFMVDRTGVDREFVTSEIDRYASDPGQALSYMIGKLEIDRLRDRASARLGQRFDIRRFHNAVLDNGALPLTVLGVLLDEWIEAQRAS